MLNFDEFYEREFASIAVVAGTVLGDRVAGEDIAQEALARAAQRWEEISQYDRPGAWVRRVAINLASNGRRSRRRELRAVTKLGAGAEYSEQPQRLGDPAVWQAVSALPSRQRAVIALRYLEDRSVAEIADILEISVSATTSSLHKARVRLAAALGEQP